MTAWALGISGTLATGLILFLLRCVRKLLISHKCDHEFVTFLKKDHIVLTDGLAELIKVNALLIENGISTTATSLLKQHKEYMDQGFITFNQYETFKRQFDSYKAMGGNGVIDKLFEDIDKLPMEV